MDNKKDNLNFNYKKISDDEILFDNVHNTNEKDFNKKEIIQILKKDLYFNGYYDDFLRCIKNHTFSNISEKNKTEMERKFIYAIKKALENL